MKSNVKEICQAHVLHHPFSLSSCQNEYQEYELYNASFVQLFVHWIQFKCDMAFTNIIDIIYNTYCTGEFDALTHVRVCLWNFSSLSSLLFVLSSTFTNLASYKMKRVFEQLDLRLRCWWSKCYLTIRSSQHVHKE